MADPDTRARNRFLALVMTRLGGAMLAIFGLLALNGKLAVPAALGWIALVAGVLAFLVVPLMMARRWRTPRG
ncbi:hypothetical protein [Aurantiacibacter spongiae]|uniref:DUF2892 domain-containing protein n=1 Tax=Aurantiacibacter spongiae TaxID=2488860 RepID=A0A3N5CTH4_9SPHN|nr:hypothetical protein [Aurantiacibacter spongiae]RPF71987.1 hypothetical protein EG799_10460 [Aurantiacibacter spongiae]